MVGQARGGGAAHVAVALGADHRGERGHQVRDVAVQRGPRRQRVEHVRQRVRQIREQAPLHQSGEAGQRDSCGRPSSRATTGCPGRAGSSASRAKRSRARPSRDWAFPHPALPHRRPRTRRSRTASRSRAESLSAVSQVANPGGGSGGDGRAPGARLDQVDVELGPPGERPRLAEGALAPALLGCPPVDAEQAQTVQQPAALQVEGLAQVKVVLAVQRLGLELHPALLLPEVALEGDHRGRVGHVAEPLPHDHAPLDQLHRQVVALAQHRPDSLGDLRQPGQRPSPQHGQALREPYRLDDVRGGDRQILVPEHSRGLGQPSLHRTVGGGEQVVVPARRRHSRAVSAPGGQPPVRPRHPGHLDLDLGQPPEQCVVGLDRGQSRAPDRALP